MVLALVAGVDEAVLALVVQLYQHAHGAPLTAAQRAELPVFIPRQRQERVSSVHQVTREQRVRVDYGWQRVHHRPRVQVNHEENLEEK